MKNLRIGAAVLRPRADEGSLLASYDAAAVTYLLGSRYCAPYIRHGVVKLLAVMLLGRVQKREVGLH